MADNVVPMRQEKPLVQRRAELWEGILRVMEANGRTKIEIGINDVREAAAMARERCQRQ